MNTLKKSLLTSVLFIGLGAGTSVAQAYLGQCKENCITEFVQCVETGGAMECRAKYFACASKCNA